MPLQLFTRSTEVKLVETLNALEKASGWQAIHFHLDRLLEEYKSDYQVKIAINLVNDLLKSYDGGVFVLSDRGIIILCERLEKTLQNKLIFQLRYLYMDDPLAYTDDGQENPDFCTTYDLGRDLQEFQDIASRRMAFTVRKATAAGRAPKPGAEEGGGAETRKAARDEFSMSGLPAIERDLRRADLRKIVRRQPVCAVLGDGNNVRKVFDELYIHIAHLRQTLNAEMDFFSNRWLFKYLTQILDERMLSQIRQDPQSYCGSPVSLNLNAETLLSSWFSEFDAVIQPSMKVSIVIEVPVVDVFADINGFVIARNEVQKLGYRVCLDGLTTKSFLNIDREKLKLDLLKIQWNADVEGDLQNKDNRDLAQAIETCGTRRIILCRCDSKQAVEYGKALGISLFQGRYIDALLDPESTVEN